MNKKDNHKKRQTKNLLNFSMRKIKNHYQNKHHNLNQEL